MPMVCFAEITIENSQLWKAYKEAPLKFSWHDLCKSCSIIRADDPAGGMGTIHLPSLVNGRTEQGLWCRGCKYASDQLEDDRLDPAVEARLVPDGYHEHDYLSVMKNRAWPSEELLQHAKNCHYPPSLLQYQAAIGSQS